MADRDALTDFQSQIETAIGRAADDRSRIILQIVAASMDANRVAGLLAELGKFPEDSPRRKIIDFPRIAEQLGSVTQQIIALDLDRTTPLRILGIGRVAGPVLYTAQCFGHSVTAVARLNFMTDVLFRLYGVPCFNPKAAGELPDGPFDFIIAYGGPHLGTKQAWASFVLPLAGRLADGGRIFVTVPREPDPRRNYRPEIVLSRLARMGARVSSRYGFVLLDRAVLRKFDPTATKSDDAPAATEPEQRPDALPILPDDAVSQPSHRARMNAPRWAIGAALIGCFTLLIGLWSRLGRSLN